MTKQDLFRMCLGSYELTDSIENYYYTMEIGSNENGSRFYKITEKGDPFVMGIFMAERIVEDKKTLCAVSGVGGLHIHSNDNLLMLSELRFIQRGSFAEFVRRADKLM